MKSLYESLLDDEEDMINDETVVEGVIEDWCKENIVDFEGNGHIDKNHKVNLDNFLNGYVQFKLKNGIIPDFIEWGDTKNAGIVCKCDVKTYKNFPTKIKGLYILDNSYNMPKDFTTIDKMEVGRAIVIDNENITSLKGLTGKITLLEIKLDNLNEFDIESDLTVDKLILGIDKKINFEKIKKLPKIKKRIEINQNLNRYRRPSIKTYNLCEQLVNNSPKLKKIFKRYLSKEHWKSEGAISVEI